MTTEQAVKSVCVVCRQPSDAPVMQGGTVVNFYHERCHKPCVHCGKHAGDNTITDQRGAWHEPCYVEANQPRYEAASIGTAP